MEENIIKNIAIVVIGYNRIDPLKNTLGILANCNYENDEVDIIISLDKSEKEQELLQVCSEYKWKHGNKIIRTFPERLGLKNHVISCGNLTQEYDGIIMFEDDIVPSPEFYTFSKQMLSNYHNNEHIGGISLYSPRVNEMTGTSFTPLHSKNNIYLMKSAQSWGQCWSKEMWSSFIEWYENNSDKLIDMGDMPNSIYDWSEKSWKKYFMKYLVVTNKYFVYPYISYSTNTHEIGTHVNSKSSKYQVPLELGKIDYKFIDLQNLVKYDVFFELENIENYLLFYDLDDKGQDICMDLYGTKVNTESKRYLLSTKIINAPVLESFGLKMRPHEMNLIYNTQGNDIFLYDMNGKSEIKGELNQLHELNYYNYLNWKRALKLSIKGILQDIKAFIYKAL